MGKKINSVAKSVIFLGWILVTLPLIWDDRKQREEDAKSMVEWWLK